MGFSSGFPVESPRFGGRREVSPSCASSSRRLRGPRASSCRHDEAYAHRGARFPRTVTGRSDRSAWLRPGPFPSVVESCRRARREWSGTDDLRILLHVAAQKVPHVAVTLPRPEGERLADPRSKSEACWPSWHSPQTVRFPAGPKTDHPLARAARLQTRLQGFEPRESPCYQPSGVTRMVGADPLMGFHLPRVFPLPGAAVPLHGLLSRTCEERVPKRPPSRAPESRRPGRLACLSRVLPTLSSFSSSSSPRSASQSPRACAVRPS
jgi:hypothetical protein